MSVFLLRIGGLYGYFLFLYSSEGTNNLSIMALTCQ